MNFLQLPVEVLPHVRRLSAVQLAIWADAWTWEKQGAKAYRTNDQLAEMFGCTVKSVSKAIAGLKSAGLIDSRMVNGRQRILTATIPSNVHPPERPSSSTSILSNVHAASPSTSTLHPPERPPCIPSNVHQVEKGVEQIVEQQVEKGAAPKKQARPKSLDDVIEAFEAVGSDSDQAERFWNHYESNGWKVGGRSAMKDWKAAARNWLKNVPTFTKHDKNTPRPAPDGGHFVGNVYVPNLENIYKNG
jgi:biotin operon repressor